MRQATRYRLRADRAVPGGRIWHRPAIVGQQRSSGAADRAVSLVTNLPPKFKGDAAPDQDRTVEAAGRDAPGKTGETIPARRGERRRRRGRRRTDLAPPISTTTRRLSGGRASARHRKHGRHPRRDPTAARCHASRSGKAAVIRCSTRRRSMPSAIGASCRRARQPDRLAWSMCPSPSG